MFISDKGIPSSDKGYMPRLKEEHEKRPFKVSKGLKCQGEGNKEVGQQTRRGQMDNKDN